MSLPLRTRRGVTDVEHAFGEGCALSSPVRAPRRAHDPQSMRQPHHYERLLWAAYAVVVGLVLLLGWVGFLAYGAGTQSIIVLNLPPHWVMTRFIQVSLMVRALHKWASSCHCCQVDSHN